MSFIPSPQQQAFFDWIEKGSGSAVLEAVAGAGKTTTLVQGIGRMKGDVFFGAYNKKIVEEIKARVGNAPGVTVNTMHSAGMKLWRKQAPRVQVDGNKMRDLYRHAALDRFSESTVLKLASLAKQSGYGIAGVEVDMLGLIAHHDIEARDTAAIVKMAERVLAMSAENDTQVIDFDDMILAPLREGITAGLFDWVLVDEAQDTNVTRRLLALAILRKGGRLVAVGDRAQAIYGFTGADSKALDLIAEATGAVRLPLTVTYRCPKQVVAYARQWVSHIEAHESAPEGVVRALSSDQPLGKIAQPGDAILCRFNAPLVEYVYAFLNAGVPAKIEGRDIANGLCKILQRTRAVTYDALDTALAKWKEKEIAKAANREDEAQVQKIEDMYRSLQLFIDKTAAKIRKPGNAVDAVCAEIQALFQDTEGEQREVVLLSSIHKSKGREWHRVFWLQTGACKWARQEWQQEQERNLMYVATTRAKHELVLVEGVK